MEIKDNQFSRQFEITVEGKMMSIEYSRQERKLFLTRINVPEGVDCDTIVFDFLSAILDDALEKKLKVVPVHPKAAAFFRKNSAKYKELLPPGLRL